MGGSLEGITAVWVDRDDSEVDRNGAIEIGLGMEDPLANGWSWWRECGTAGGALRLSWASGPASEIV